MKQRRPACAYWHVSVAIALLVLPRVGLAFKAFAQGVGDAGVDVGNSAAESSSQANEERKAEAALKEFGLEIARNENGEVTSVMIGSKFSPSSPSKFGDPEIVHLENLTWSKTPDDFLLLDVRYANITNSGVERIARIAEFNHLGFNRSRLITDEGLVHLERLSKLEVLLLDKTGISDNAVETFKKLKALKHLGLIGVISDDGLEELSELENLERLNLSFTKVTDVGLEHLAKLVNLRRLLLSGTSVSNDGLKHLKSLKKLQHLFLGQCSRVTDDGLGHLTDLTELATLDLTSIRITDESVVHLRNLAKLQSLTLNGTEISDVGLEQLKNLRNLKQLSLSSTKVTDQGLIHLKGLASLEVLALDDTNIGDQGFERLKELISLKFLSVQNTKVGDQGLEHLAESRNLQTVDLRGTSVTDDGIESLLKALPNCDVGDWWSWRRQVTGVKPNPASTYFSPGPDLSERNKKSSPPDPFTSLPSVAPTAELRGTIPIGDLATVRRVGRIIKDQSSWARLWSILKPDDPPREIDFGKSFALVSVGYDFRIDVDLRIDKEGHVYVSETVSPGTIRAEASFVVTVVPREGIKSVKDRNKSSATLARFR